MDCLQNELPFELLKKRIVDQGEPVVSFIRQRDVQKHLSTMRREFSGQSELVYHHAEMIVLIRRANNQEYAVDRFWRMWVEETDYLKTNLNLRWLVSACDTISDVAVDPNERSVAAIGSVLINTIKLYETERLLLKSAERDCGGVALVARGQPQNLFDGMSTFLVGYGDMVHNLMERLYKTSQGADISGAILRELLSRINHNDTVYQRFLHLHENDATRW